MKYYDYSRPAFYYVTVVVKNRKKLLGKVEGGAMEQYPAGIIVENCWLDLPNHYPNIRLDSFVVMPNHAHGIIEIVEHANANSANDQFAVGAGLRPAHSPDPARTQPKLSQIIRAFKSYSSQRVNIMNDTEGSSLWQRGYFERILRNEREINEKREYIKNNPRNWSKKQHSAVG